MRAKKKRWLLLMFVALALGAYAFWMLEQKAGVPFVLNFNFAHNTKDQAKGTGVAENKDSVSTPRPALAVEVVKPRTVSWPVQMQASGDIVAWQEASVGGKSNGLRLLNVYANVGDAVKKDQLLASFTTDAPEAELLQAQANYENAKANAQRARSLQDSNALSQQQLEQYLTQEQVTKALLQIARSHYADTRLLSPDDGVISARNATVGAVVGSGQELFRLIRKGRLEWHAEVAPQDIARIALGDQATVFAVSGVEVKGKVRAIAPSVNAQTRKIVVYVDIPEHNGITAGMFATGVFHLGKQSGLSLPKTAVLLRDGFAYVYVVDSSQRVFLRKVQVGLYQGDTVQILSGLSDAESVVASGVGFLRDGDVVNVVQQP